METLNKTMVGKYAIVPIIFFIPVMYYALRLGSLEKAFEKFNIH